MSPLGPNSEFAPASGPRPTAPPGHLHGRLDDLREGGSDAELGFGREVEPWRIQYKDIRGSRWALSRRTRSCNRARRGERLMAQPLLVHTTYISHSCVLWIVLCVLFDRFWEAWHCNLISGLWVQALTGPGVSLNICLVKETCVLCPIEHFANWFCWDLSLLDVQIGSMNSMKMAMKVDT